ncbi:helicase-related protein [Pontibacter ramchanderi]|uniref:SNF2 family DNA or RNA helicase n=1 Tax=Pontibacter ramchanderi TaxID=1179743 RepID=A0A2N3V2P2_9BACT|nr:helicase-related protein [Pontibacter ramchanderi]PKV75890.1 SNF2 family DNA or RNA helicase [Pontibacter ramchanderi]
MESTSTENKQHNRIGVTLKESITEGSKLSVISSYFTIYAFQQLQKELEGIEEVRFLFDNPVFGAATSNPLSIRPVHILGDHTESLLKSKLNLQKVAKECAEWVGKKAKIRSTKHANHIGTKFLHVHNVVPGPIAINTSRADFTATGLGFAPSNTRYFYNVVTGVSETIDMLQFFDEQWDNPAFVDDIKQDVLKQLEYAYKDHTPQFLYFFTLYNLFKDYLEELDEEKIVKSKTGFKDTLVWNKLYKFQKDGVLGAIDKIERYNGCIIADSVGLGKTFEALAVIKYYELRNDRVLVLCPKKLRDNWTVYTLNDRRNSLADDRFNYDVLNHTDLSREEGLSGEINLKTINWGNYDLVVIDESHNFRNNNAHRDHQTRYTRLMNQIIKAGVRTKVLMLSATPVNNRMNDLKNQVAFITEGDDMAFENQGIDSIHEVMKRAQLQFNKWLTDEEADKTVESLLETLDSRYFKLLDLVTIARSRKHIEKYYNISDIGEFPKRNKPENIKSDIDRDNLYPSLHHVNMEIRRLSLSAYAPLKYIRPDKEEEYSARYDMFVSSGRQFRQKDREESLIHLMRVNMLKRMESSIHSFGITLGNLLYKIDKLLEKIQNKSDYYDESLSIEEIEIDDPQLEDFLIGNKTKVLLQDIDDVRWKDDLLEDRNRLQQLLEATLQIDAGRDKKLLDLKALIKKKVENPLNPDNKKLIVFTAFADTANYLYDEIATWAKTELGISSALVTGAGQNKTNHPGVRSDLNEILTNFSPVSKERTHQYPHAKGEIDLLIATDCISEGQNLQDCDYLVNYDIHWNPVRIIQRFGRIDRLGSKNSVIQLVNFWPNMDLDEYINLEARVSGRMVLLDISATGEENVIEQTEKDQMNDLDYRRKQLEQLQDSVVDLEEMHGGISITDLTLNDFKMELMEYLKTHRGDLERTPTGVHAVVTASESDIKPGVIFCLKHLKEAATSKHTQNALAPYYLAYVNEAGEMVNGFMQSKKILDIYQKLCSGQNEVLPELIQQFKKETKQGHDMSLYQKLLEDAVQHIKGKSLEKGVMSLFSPEGTATFKEQVQSVADFEVVSFLVVMNPQA